MSGMEFLNAQITGTAKALVLNLDWYMVYWANEEESIDETETEDGFYTGIWQNRELIASDEAVVRLTTFYELYGTQYAVGEIETLNDIRWCGHKEVQTWVTIVRIAARSFIPALVSAPNAARRRLPRPRSRFPQHSRNLCHSQ